MFKRMALGAAVLHHKGTANLATEVLAPPAGIVLPMSQHIGAACTPAVKKGDTVYVGTVVGRGESPISADIHSGVSGTVEGVVPIAFPQGGTVSAVIIASDGKQTPDPGLRVPEVTDAASLAAAARACGLVGLGGAGFPTAVKLSPKGGTPIDTLILNGSECEPYITSDNREMLECSDSILRGVKAVKEHLGINRVIIAIERNKPEAIDLMLSLTQGEPGYKVHALKSRYPQGAEKVLIEKTTRREVPRGGLPSDVGVLVMNVTTVSALGKFLATGMPLTTKRLTVDGSAVSTPKNVQVVIGTPMREVLAHCGLSEDCGKLIMGGPMMGTALVTPDFPVLKQNNALLAFTEADAHLPEPQSCIRCGRCIAACPMGLAPVEIVGAFKNSDVPLLDKLMADLCMSCGCCTYVCPAKLPVSQNTSLAKNLHQNGGK